MFSRFLLFFGAAGGDLVHDSSQNPVPPFPLHQVRVPFRRPAGADLVHDSTQNPCSFVDGHHVFGAKGAAGEPAGADLVHDSPQTLALDVLPVNRTMKKYKICVTIILNFLLVIF